MPTDPAGSDPIKHVILLMLENHSFDQMLGIFQTVYPELDGINPKSATRVNKDRRGREYAQLPMTERQMIVDPMHEVEHVSKQIGGGKNSGFVLDLEQQYAQASEEQKRQIMGYYPMDFLPALHPLAHDFTICDQWFSSLPGPTWPNRLFALSGTSSGIVQMPEGKEEPDLQGFFQQHQDTIFDRLDEGKVSWKVYCHDIPQSIVLTNQRKAENRARYFSFDDFIKDAQGRESAFPQFSFIEPRYSGEDQNDDHPPHDVMKAQQLIASVYNAIRANGELWNSTLLVVLYDEHGGFYDHVAPPAAVAPDALATEYSFRQYGIRVPALLVSPWTKRGVLKTRFDHTSLLRYMIEKWRLRPLTARVSQANSIAAAIATGGEARKDTVKFLKLSADQKRSPNAELAALASVYDSDHVAALQALAHVVSIEMDLKLPKAFAATAAPADFIARVMGEFLN
jgi:phospholipase C